MSFKELISPELRLKIFWGTIAALASVGLGWVAAQGGFEVGPVDVGNNYDRNGALTSCPGDAVRVESLAETTSSALGISASGVVCAFGE